MELMAPITISEGPEAAAAGAAAVEAGAAGAGAAVVEALEQAARNDRDTSTRTARMHTMKYNLDFCMYSSFLYFF